MQRKIKAAFRKRKDETIEGGNGVDPGVGNKATSEEYAAVPAESLLLSRIACSSCTAKKTHPAPMVSSHLHPHSMAIFKSRNHSNTQRTKIQHNEPQK
jgi:hypothetical protein